MAGAAGAECVEAPDPSSHAGFADAATTAAGGPTSTTQSGRVVAPVRVNGEGPFRFIVDTGANRSVLSVALAERLGLAPQGAGQVHSVHGVTVAPLVSVDSLRYGDLSFGHSSMPVLQGAVLGGEHGLLGVDGMSGRRLLMDFERNCIEIAPAQGARRLRDWVAIRGQLRFGHLVVIQGSINGVRTQFLVDTGSDASLANTALREALGARIRHDRSAEVIAFTASDPIELQNAIFIRRISIGELEVRDVMAFVGDYHIFDLWGLSAEPTLLIGMDVLSQTRGIAVDYERGVVYLHLDPAPRTGSRVPR